jgi:hypothetical protein
MMIFVALVQSNTVPFIADGNEVESRMVLVPGVTRQAEGLVGAYTVKVEPCELLPNPDINWFVGPFSESVMALATIRGALTIDSKLDSLLGVSTEMGAVGTLREAKATLVRARGVIAEQLEIIEMPHRGVVFDAESKSAQGLSFNILGTSLASCQGSISPAQVAPVEAGLNFLSSSLHPGFGLSPYFQGVIDELQSLALTAWSAVRTALYAWDFNLTVAIRVIQDRLSVLFHSVSNTVMLFCSVSWPKRRWFLCHGARPPKDPVQGGSGPVLGACFGSCFAS